jgi:DhnA family fructose-bisphosphate aldolase class Ia
MNQNEIIVVIDNILSELAQPGIPTEIEYFIVSDKINHQYQVLASGWQGMKRTFGVVVHIRLKNNLIWVEEDNTDYGVVEEMVRLGIPKNQIVLAFHAPYKRPYTGYATGESTLA